MANRISLMHLARRFSSEKRGTAAVEFALLLPTLMALSFGMFEVYFRYVAEDQFNRYINQTGDLIARSDQLFTADIANFLGLAQRIMVEVDTHDVIELHVASIGFKKDKTPVVLWQRSAGGDPITIDTEDAAGVGLALETVMRVEAHFTYTSPFQYLMQQNPILKKKVVYYKPRVTRAIAIDGNVAETNADWED